MLKTFYKPPRSSGRLYGDGVGGANDAVVLVQIDEGGLELSGVLLA